MSAAAAAGVAQALIGLYPLKQALLTRHATGVLVALADSSASNLPADSLAELLKVRGQLWSWTDVPLVTRSIAHLRAALPEGIIFARNSIRVHSCNPCHASGQGVSFHVDAVRYR